eukprot:207776_1
MHTSIYDIPPPSISIPRSNLNKPKRNKKNPSVVTKTKRDNEHLQIWLKTRQLLSDDFHYNPDTNNNATNKYDQQLLESTKQSIIESFGTFNDILNVFIQNGNKQQLSNIYDILKNLRLNNQPIVVERDRTCKQPIVVERHRVAAHNLQQRLNDDESDTDSSSSSLSSSSSESSSSSSSSSSSESSSSSSSDEHRKRKKRKKKKKKLRLNNHYIKNKYRGFMHLSSAEICCITDYLPKQMINKFKLCSRKIGIVCLQQMNKMTVGVYNMNKLIYHKQKDIFSLNTA